MKRFGFVIASITVFFLFSGLAIAEIFHPEDGNIVGGVFNGHACFNNDGAVASLAECDGSGTDEGNIGLDSFFKSWKADSPSGINYCFDDSVDPVSSASCSFSTGLFFECSDGEYQLVQTTKSGHYWAVKASADCTSLTTPEAEAIVPCLVTDSFDSATGCTSMPPVDPSPPVISIEDGYIQPSGSTTPPPDEHCNHPTHVGRMVADGINDIIYLCTVTGWSKH